MPGPQTSAFAFEVATIKPAAPSPDGHVHINYPAGGRFSASNITLLALMVWAFELPEKQTLQGPPWMASTRFDFQASSDAATDAHLRSLASADATALKREMVRTMLVDRFALTVHGETRVLPAYDLLVAKSGSKLQPTHSNGKSISAGPKLLRVESLDLPLIAQQLSSITGRIVLDKTGLPGRYDLTLRWTPDDEPAGDDAMPSFFTALQEQLGLKLESAKEAIPVLVVDHVESPSPN